MKVYKFGGASINSIDRIKSTSAIIAGNQDIPLLVVISAMGKTTNFLEKIVEAFFAGKSDESLLLFRQLKESHQSTLKYLVTKNWKVAEEQLNSFFTEMEWLLHDQPVRHFDYYYDQVVCCGELMSSCIVYHYLLEQSVDAAWVDARDLIRTDNNFRDAQIDWVETEKNINQRIRPILEKKQVLVTQGFIGSTDENESTTLGREGSDFSAAIFANILQAASVTIWKDVEAVMSADPKEFPSASSISALSYMEVIEMAYYGAQVIHPKTIKPLQNKEIPLYVKSFIIPQLSGTVINSKASAKLPPIIVQKKNQVLIRFQSKDFSFVEDKPVQELHKLFNSLKIKPNLSQHTAISLLCAFDEHPEKIDKLAFESSELFDVELEKKLTLLTIRHYDEKTIRELTTGKQVVLEQKTMETLQVLLRIV